jgi:hypothetical protein
LFPRLTNAFDADQQKILAEGRGIKVHIVVPIDPNGDAPGVFVETCPQFMEESLRNHYHDEDGDESWEQRKAELFADGDFLIDYGVRVIEKPTT